MRVAITLIASALAAFTYPASAEIITRCGGSKGMGYYFEGPVTPASESGWREDGITGGEILLLMDGDAPDIVYTDATGRTVSERADGATVIQLKGADAHFRLILVIYPAGAAEHYVFRLDGRGNGKVVWGDAKIGLVPKATLMEAACHQP